ncbi:hypothetical protein EDD11_002406 [Mortierella claussenii]|nr:hypothetical protein EDD11_002406 [Mortierella claussenii]
MTSSSGKKAPMVYQNLVAKQKAVYQPTFEFRKWLEENRRIVPEGANLSVGDIESNMPALRGEGTDFASYAAYQEVHQQQLEYFYGRRYHKHNWDSRRAKEFEYAALTDQLLRMVGGRIGEQRKNENKVAIGIGLGQFSSNSKLSSLHGSFSRYFIRKARSQGYIVIGVNEFYTSKRCHDCNNIVCEVELRRLCCRHCETYFHRNVMAGHHITNVVQGHLLHLEQPHYLQPVDERGNLI